MRKLFVLLLLLAVVLAACDDTGDRAADETSAQSLLPTINGYTTYESTELQDSITAAGAGAALASGNVPLAAGIARADAVIDCLQFRGAVAAQAYVETQPQELVPEAGAVFILNTTRLAENLVSCLTQTGPDNPSALNVQVEPCAEGGSFRFGEEDFSYMYIGAGDRLCGFFEQHFSNLGATTSS